jgi:hypothetical protein
MLIAVKECLKTVKSEGGINYRHTHTYMEKRLGIVNYKMFKKKEYLFELQM